MDRPHLLRQRGHHAARPARARRPWSPILGTALRQPVEPARAGRRRTRPWSTRRAPMWPRSSARIPERSSSPAAAPRPTTWRCSACSTGPEARAGAPHRHRDRAPRRASRRPKYLERRGVEVTYLAVSATTASSRRGHARLGAAPAHAAGLGHDRQQRGRHHPADPRDRRSSPTGTARCSTPTRCRPPARCRSTSRARRSTCSPSRPTSSTGPKGVGALYVRSGVRLQPSCYGGGQERGLRSATENVAGIVGFGAPPPSPAERWATETARLVGLREQLLDGIAAADPQRLLHRRPLPPAARPPVPGVRRAGGRGGQAAAEARRAGHRRLIRQRLQLQPRR